ncbi:MAG: sucrase ferredoxin [Nocardioides sp.]
MTFRCSVARESRGDALAGTATQVRGWLLIEHQGPWGIDALRDARMPVGVGVEIKRVAADHRIRPLLIRRPNRPGHDRPEPEPGIRVFAAVTRHDRAFLEATTVESYADVLALDLAALGRGHSPGLDAYDGLLYLVCTHGRHDACCAERGRPLAAASAGLAPDETWECSHIGGDRFAANLLALPTGAYYGSLTPESVGAVVSADRAGELHLDLLRGRCVLPMAAQAAEIALRRELGLLRVGDVVVTGVSRDGTRTTAEFGVRVSTRLDRPGGLDRVDRWRVVVETVLGPPAALTCRATADNPVPRHRIVAIEPVVWGVAADRPPEIGSRS